MKRVSAFIVCVMATLIFFGCSTRRYKPLHSSEHILSIFIVQSEIRKTECETSIMDALTEVEWAYLTPPNPYLSTPYVHVIYDNGDEERISADCVIISQDGLDSYRYGYFDPETFQSILKES